MKKILIFLLLLGASSARAQSYLDYYLLTGTFAGAGPDYTNTILIQAPTLAASWTLTLPTTAGTSGYFLQTDGTGVTTWAAASAGTVHAVLYDPATASPTQIIQPTASGFAALTLKNNAADDAVPVVEFQMLSSTGTPLFYINSEGQITDPSSSIYPQGGMIVDAAGDFGSVTMTNGQLLIGRTGNTPVAANLTAGTGISITNSSGGISIAATSTSPHAVLYDPATASPTQIITPSADIVPLTIDNGNVIYMSNLQEWKANGVVVAKMAADGNLTLGTSTNAGVLDLHDNSGSYIGVIQPTSLTANRSYTLPDNDGNVLLYSGTNGGLLTAGTGITVTTGSNLTTVALTTPVTVANGGTGVGTHTAHGVLIGEGTSAVAATSAGTARQLLVSSGASDPVWTTETYAVPGASGHVLTSDGTNWTSAVPAASGGPYTITNNNILNVSTDGLTIQNTTATLGSAANQQQWSPRIRLTGQGWKTNATAGSQAEEWIIENRPVSGSASPAGILAFAASVNGGAYTDFLTFKKDNSGSTGSAVIGGIESSNLTFGTAVGSGTSGAITIIESQSGGTTSTFGGDLILRGGNGNGHRGGDVYLQTSFNGTPYSFLQGTLVTSSTEQIIIGQSSLVTPTIVLKNASNTNTLTLAQTTPTTARTITFPDATGTVALAASGGGTLTAGNGISVTNSGGTSTVAMTGTYTGVFSPTTGFQVNATTAPKGSYSGGDPSQCLLLAGDGTNMTYQSISTADFPAHDTLIKIRIDMTSFSYPNNLTAFTIPSSFGETHFLPIVAWIGSETSYWTAGAGIQIGLGVTAPNYNDFLNGAIIPHTTGAFNLVTSSLTAWTQTDAGSTLMPADGSTNIAIRIAPTPTITAGPPDWFVDVYLLGVYRP